MKLLTKSEIEQNRAKERKLEIDEGMKLARHVDKLRKTVADEQKSLGVFADANSKELVGQIATLVDEKETLTLEVNDLREQRRIERIPLDAEWDEVKKVRGEIAERELAVGTEELRLDAKREHIEREDERIRERENAADLQAANALDLFNSAKKRDREVYAHAAEVDAKAEANEKALKHRELTLNAREATIASRERDNKNRTKNLEKREKALADEERRVQDLYQTYIRTQERDGKRSKGRK